MLIGCDPFQHSSIGLLGTSLTAANPLRVQTSQMEKRAVYTTPKAFLELIGMYRKLLKDARADVGSSCDRLANGLEKLRSTQVHLPQPLLSTALRKALKPAF